MNKETKKQRAISAIEARFIGLVLKQAVKTHGLSKEDFVGLKDRVITPIMDGVIDALRIMTITPEELKEAEEDFGGGDEGPVC